MKRSFWLLSMFFLISIALILNLTGCGKEATTSEPSGNEGSNQEVEETVLSQEEILAEIDRITDEVNDGEMSVDQGIEELRATLPAPEGYPRRNIEYVIAWGEGGGSDLYARHITKDASEILGVNIVLNNMPGGNGEIGLVHVLSQPADGHTLYGAVATQVVNEATGDQDHVFTQDTEFIIRNQGATEVFWVRDDSPFETFDDVIEYERANPGTVTVIGGGIEDDLRVAELNSQLGIEIVSIPSQSSGERVASLLGGHVDMLHETAGALLDLYNDGQVRPILVPGDDAFAGLEAQTTADIGVDITIGRWRGINAPVGTDPEIVEYLHNVFYAASKLPFYRDYAEESLFHLVDSYRNSEDYKASAVAEVETVKGLLKEFGFID